MKKACFKATVFLIFVLTAGLATAQKTMSEVVSQAKGVVIVRTISGSDTVFTMSGQNDQYAHIADQLILKTGTAQEINALLMECMKFLPEKGGASLEYEGNKIGATGRNSVVLFGSGNDDRGNVLLNKASITKLQEGLRRYL
jgi:hypothetical protein